jgi:hypothetical protein
VTDFTAVVQWGDGMTTTLSSSAFQSQSPNSGNFAVQTHHLYATAGTYTLSVQVADVGGASINAKIRIAVH